MCQGSLLQGERSFSFRNVKLTLQFKQTITEILLLKKQTTSAAHSDMSHVQKDVTNLHASAYGFVPNAKSSILNHNRMQVHFMRKIYNKNLLQMDAYCHLQLHVNGNSLKVTEGKFA